MKFAALSIAALSIGAIGFPGAAAEIAGAWHVTGKVSSFAFTLNCEFKPDGPSLGGVCVDASTNDAKVKTGQSHPLTAGHVKADQISWTYQSHFLLSKFDVTYNGTLNGDRMSGSIDAQGKTGTFTATKQ